jgi:hypothetical protein
VFSVDAGAKFGYTWWVVLLATVGIIVYGEMSGRIAAVTGKPVFKVDSPKSRLWFGPVITDRGKPHRFHACAAEIGGVAMILKLLSILPTAFTPRWRWCFFQPSSGLSLAAQSTHVEIFVLIRSDSVVFGKGKVSPTDNIVNQYIVSSRPSRANRSGSEIPGWICVNKSLDGSAVTDRISAENAAGQIDPTQRRPDDLADNAASACRNSDGHPLQCSYVKRTRRPHLEYRSVARLMASGYA